MNGHNIIKRRNFLKGMALLGLFPMTSCQFGSEQFQRSAWMGPEFKYGHLLLKNAFSKAEKLTKKKVLIIGGGIGGLSAAYRLKKKGFEDFHLLELENEVGGNARSGSNSSIKYPLGAHYLPSPPREARYVRELLEDMNIIKGYDSANRPQYSQEDLRGAPGERLFFRGRWQDGLIPEQGLSKEERFQTEQFFKLLDKFYKKNGKRAFSIPSDLTNKDAELMALDQISFSKFLFDHNISAPSIRWYIDYCCLDDYGAKSDGVSAWAGLHYFLSRREEQRDESTLTWDEGNSKISDFLFSKNKEQVRTHSLVYSVIETKNGFRVSFMNTLDSKSYYIDCENIILASPKFITNRILEKKNQTVEMGRYIPWVVGNILLKDLESNSMDQMSWDNVSFHANSLGFIHSSHQSLKSHLKESVLTWYKPIYGEDEGKIRKKLLTSNVHSYQNEALEELNTLFPHLKSKVSKIEMWRWGHGMISPRVGYCWNEKRRQEHFQKSKNLFFAHSDISGLSLFEEANYWGNRAAESILKSYGLS